jgi:iron complex transport system ATP-binding protein
VLTDPVDAGAMTGADLVALGRHPHTGWSGRLSDDDRAAVAWALEATRATGLAARPLSQLSDGERQRLLLARALAQQPQVLALDEPIAFVDVPRRVELLRLLRRLARASGMAVLLTTHDVDLALRSADVLWLLQPGNPATLVSGAPEDLVLAGAVARAFSADDVAFATDRGTFVSTDAPAATAVVLGAGAAGLWAQRALEREGVAVVGRSSDPDLVVEVLDGPAWRLTAPGGITEHPTLAALAQQVRSALPVPAAAEEPGRRHTGAFQVLSTGRE